MRKLKFLIALLFVGVVACGGGSNDKGAAEGELNGGGETAADGKSAAGNSTTTPKEPTILYGIEADNYAVEDFKIESGETVGKILNRYGISASKIDQLDKAAKEVFPLNKLQAGKQYTLFLRDEVAEDGTTKRIADYMVYHINTAEYVVYDLCSEQASATKDSKPREKVRKRAESVITSSLWDAVVGQGLPWALATEFEDIYQWTVDFFHLQEGDSFVVIYDDEMVDGQSVKIGRIWGAKFVHKGKEVYAIPYSTNGSKVEYWEYDGESLKKQMLKCPVKYTRISSKFTYKRKHPVHGDYRPHTGVDYAAPAGTPVYAVADGEVVLAQYKGGGGNTVYIQHAAGMKTGYLHLQKFASGIKVGKYVSQGDVIGYVGSTGTSTGPHLDYRIWQNGTPVDPLSLTQQPSEPIGDKYRADFERVRDLVIAELNGTGSYQITEDDIFHRN